MPPTLSDLYLAFRQAKTALFYEKRGVGLLGLADFESQLRRRLKRLQDTLSRNEGWFDSIPIGDVWVVPKRRRTTTNGTEQVIHVGSAEGSIEASDLDVQFRLSPTPEFAIVEVLFLWHFGRAIDGLLSRNAVGYRLDIRNGRFDQTRRWLFQYWPARYQEYRTAPLDAARHALRQTNGAAVVLSADFASFYDSVDPSFLLNQQFTERLASGTGESNFPLADYFSAARSLLAAYESFRQIASQRTGLPVRIGVPIGSLTSRLIANASLEPLDRAILQQPNLLCYRRYVDDLVIVAKASPDDTRTFQELLSSSIPHISGTDGTFRLDSAALERPGSEFELQSRKIKIHHLTGVEGEDFLATIQSDFQNLVSGRRGFIDTSVFVEKAIDQLINAGRADGTPLRVLRDADRIKIQHFALSNMLHSLQRTSAMVDPESASDLVGRALDRIVRFLAGENDWVEHLEVAFRILRLAISTQDADEFRKLNGWFNNIWGSTSNLKRSVSALYHRNRRVNAPNAWIWLRNYLHARRLEAVCTALTAPVDSTPDWINGELTLGTRPVSSASLIARAQILSNADLRAHDREDDELGARQTKARRSDTSIVAEFDIDLQTRLRTIGKFIRRCKELGDSHWQIPPSRLFLCTRPPSYFDISRRWLYRVETEGFTNDVFLELQDLVNAVRGTQYREPVGRVIDESTVEIPAVRSGSDSQISRNTDPRVILGNLVVKDKEFFSAATRVPNSAFGQPSLTLDRLSGLVNILNEAVSADRWEPGNGGKRDSVLVLPELSVPRAWFRSVANYVAATGRFGLVMGLEYLHAPQQRWVYNQVYAILPLPFRQVASWPWTKRFPAREEEEHLNRLQVSFPQTKKPHQARTVVRSPYGHFSVLICSEMIESRRVADLLGRVEMVLAPSWNTDTASYDHLIQSIGLQLHAIIAVANNGHYSDCRAWAPLTTRWERDLCRLIERDTNDVVFVDVPLTALRAFRTDPTATPSKSVIKKSGRKFRPLPPDWP